MQRIPFLVCLFAVLVSTFLSSSSTAQLAPGDAVVSDPGAGLGGRGAIFQVDPTSGQRLLASDFGNVVQGPTGFDLRDLLVQSSGRILCLDPVAGSNGRGTLFAVEMNGGQRTVLSDFGNNAQGPLGSDPLGLAFEPRSGQILVADEIANLLFRVDASNGQRTVLSDFGNPGQGTLGSSPRDVAADSQGRLWVTDTNAGTAMNGALFRVESDTGQRSLVSDFGNAAQGTTATNVGLLVAEPSGDLVVASWDPFGTDWLLRVDPNNGQRTILSILNTPACPTGEARPVGLALEDDGDLLLSVAPEAMGATGVVYRVDPGNGNCTSLSVFANGAQGPVGVNPFGVAVWSALIFADGFERGDSDLWP